MNPEIKNLPVLIRHRWSGVWIGYIRGAGRFPNTILLEGRRVWSWREDRLECSQLAVKGVSAKDSLGEWISLDLNVEDGLIELYEINPSLVEDSKKFPAWVG